MRWNGKAIIKKISDKLSKAQKEVPKILANEGKNFFNHQFAYQRWDNSKWDNVKRKERGTPEFKYPKKKFLSRRTNPILVGKTRQLKNAVNRSIKSVNPNRIVWGIQGNVGKIAYYHNYGIGQKKRQFMGASSRLKQVLRIKARQIYKNNIR